MEIKELEKDSYSEWVVRNALYWLSPVTGWKLEESETQWLIHLDDKNGNARATLDRLLNDYILRERLMRRTEGIRDAIADCVLEGIQRRLAP